ncbi:hypothetical protein BJV74DRAFT_796676 [Russula compacta]|nr:hypothetical protein BJV74DRAFT_796676 [Russula compacta]
MPPPRGSVQTAQTRLLANQINGTRVPSRFVPPLHTPEYCQGLATASHLQCPLNYRSSLSKILLEQARPPERFFCLCCFNVALISSDVPQGSCTVYHKYTYVSDMQVGRLAILNPASSIFSLSWNLPFLMHFFHTTSQMRADIAPTHRRSTTISAMEEEFGICDPPQAVFTVHAQNPPSKTQESSTQAPEPRRNSSFLKGSWETVWGCDEEDVSLVESPPDEDLDAFSDSVPEHGEKDSIPDQDVATPMNNTLWGTDGEITPQFSSNFPSTLDPDALRHEGHPDGEFSRINASCPAELDKQ